MVLQLGVIVAVIVAALLRGGSLLNVGLLRLRLVGFMVAGLLVQVLIFTPLGEALLPGAAIPLLYMLSMVLLAAGAFANRRVPGMGLIIVGLLLNFLAIATNGGYMPVSPANAQLAGRIERYQPQDGRAIAANSVATDDARLWILTDILPMPGANVYSIGDVLLMIGAIILLYSAIRRPLEPGS